MKKCHLFLSLIAAATITASCDDTHKIENTTNDNTETSVDDYSTRAFAKPDGSKKLNGTPNQNLKAIFESTGPEIITSLGRLNITEEQYQEIAEFTTELVKSKTSQMDKYTLIFNWITRNIKYNNPTNNPSNTYYSNDPYDVFVNKITVCEGYSGLLTVMCYSQGIPAVVINGLGWGMGHAWAYTCPDGTWQVSDPTNNGRFSMSKPQDYSHLTPSEADVDLFTDECGIYRYYDYNINVHEVTTTDNPLIVPYSAGGFVIGSFNPKVLPESITDIYLGENITTLGESSKMNLVINNVGKNICAIYVDENNPMLLDHKGVVYKKNGDESQLYYIPGGMEHIELLPMEKVEKNTIYSHQSVKEIYFPKGTKEIENYAIEKCPKLERVYIPTDAEIAKNALYDCPKNVEIIRGEPNGIKHVTMD